jgi:phage antirepressor YoqD-like protein
LRLAAEAIEERDRLALENQAKAEALAIAAPKAQALDRIASPTEGAVCLRVAAKLLQMPEKQFLQFASAEGFVFRNHHSRIWQGYAEKAKASLVELKLTTIERDDGSTKTVEQVLITRGPRQARRTSGKAKQMLPEEPGSIDGNNGEPALIDSLDRV